MVEMGSKNTPEEVQRYSESSKSKNVRYVENKRFLHVVGHGVTEVNKFLVRYTGLLYDIIIYDTEQ